MNTARDHLDEARRQATAGHHLRQLDAARRVVVLGGELADEARYEIVTALVSLFRLAEAEATLAELSTSVSDLLRVRTRGVLAYGYVLAGRVDEAYAALEGFGELMAEQGTPADRCMGHVTLSRLAQAKNQPIEAIQHADRALEAAELAGPDSISIVHYHLGYLWLEFGVHDEAVAAFGLALAQPDLQPARRAHIHIGACLAHRAIEDFKPSRQHAERAVELHREGERIYREGAARLALAETVAEAGDSDGAIQEVRRAIALFMQAESSATEMEGRLCLGSLLLSAGDGSGGEAELARVLAEPTARVHHPEARVLLAERAEGPEDARLEGLDALLSRDELEPKLRARGALALARVHVDQTALRWFTAYGSACEQAGALDAKRRYRVIEIRDQLAALRQEQKRAAELSEALATQEHLRRAAEEAETERRDLLELVAHDLRNPLCALLLVLEGVVEAEDSDEVLELVALGQQSGEAMRMVLEDALAASGSIGDLGELERVDLGSVARASVGAFEPIARAKGQVLQLPSCVDVQVEGVTTLLRSVFDNLVSNALKFTPRGGHIHVRMASTGPSVRVSVADDGPGIAAGEEVTLFKRRVRGTARPTAGEPSTGLGLYLVRKVVESHGGSVGVGPSPSGGSEFWFELPAET